MPVHIGTSGWHYAHWRGGFYPAGVPAGRWLEHYAERFATVEVNNAFYRLPEATTFARWRDQLPDDFVVALKASRYLTHVRKLRDPKQPVRLLVERASSLGEKLGPVLLQLPPTLQIDLDALVETIGAFPKGIRVAVEPRHPSWFTPETRAELERLGAALCLADSAGPVGPLWRTAAFGYVRFHGGRARPAPCYGTASLHSWAERLAELWPARADVYVYFNNDAHGCAPRDARRFASAARKAGLVPTRVPASSQTPVSSA